jgi:hypothetical protein
VGRRPDRRQGQPVLRRHPGGAQHPLCSPAASTQRSPRRPGHRRAGRQDRPLPAHQGRSVTWDQGIEMVNHPRFTHDTGVPSTSPSRSPWQGGSNQNTNGLQRQCLPKAPICNCTPSATWTPSPKPSTTASTTLGWTTPSEAFTAVVCDHRLKPPSPGGQFSAVVDKPGQVADRSLPPYHNGHRADIDDEHPTGCSRTPTGKETRENSAVPPGCKTR